MRRVALIFVALIGMALTLFLGYGVAHWFYNRPLANDSGYVDRFDSGNLEGWLRQGVAQLCCEHSLRFDDDTSRIGEKSLHFSLRRDDRDVKGSKRAELRLRGTRFGKDYWYRFSIRLPEDWKVDRIPVTLVQWHAVPDKILGEAGRSPPLRIAMIDGMWGIDSFWDSKSITRWPWSEEDPEGYAILWKDPAEFGVWIDWSVHVRWSAASDGVTEIWKDGKSIVSRRGPNTYNDITAPYLKIGIYVPDWKVGRGDESILRREVWFDRISSTEGGDPGEAVFGRQP